MAGRPVAEAHDQDQRQAHRLHQRAERAIAVVAKVEGEASSAVQRDSSALSVITTTGTPRRWHPPQRDDFWRVVAEAHGHQDIARLDAASLLAQHAAHAVEQLAGLSSCHSA